LAVFFRSLTGIICGTDSAPVIRPDYTTTTANAVSESHARSAAATAGKGAGSGKAEAGRIPAGGDSGIFCNLAHKDSLWYILQGLTLNFPFHQKYQGFHYTLCARGFFFFEKIML
jgi:hypothetical protein